MELKPEELGRRSLQEKMKAIDADQQIPVFARLLRGETVNIQGNEDIYYGVNANRVPMDEFVEREKFREVAGVCAIDRSMNRQNNGYTDKRTLRLIGRIPANVMLSRDEFRKAGVKEAMEMCKRFLRRFPKFMSVDGGI